MNEIWNMARTPEFWFATVLVGLFLNFGTTLFFRWFDRFWPQWTNKRRAARIEEEKSRDELADRVRGSGLDIIYKQNLGMDLKIDANMEFIGALACLAVCQNYGFQWLSLTYFVLGMLFVRAGLHDRKRGNRLIDIAWRACYRHPEKSIDEDAPKEDGKDLKNIDEGHGG